ncbi:MAG: cell division protein FtsL [Candidatus Tectomicrobia bacterium]|uniref:Cell division protein FtsL n=1 Tax=Tectimicrobiota bacterium TaxID=2528274 RepID=A0A932M059_UNCTE|nr:cell division protein FtsL [Candidatus Tectomicrobia bacterium]
MNGFRSQPYRLADFSLAPDVPFGSERQEAGEERARVRFRLTSNACYGIALTFLLVGVLIYLWPRLQMVKQVYHYQALQSQYKTLSEEQRRLKIDLGTLQSLSRIDRVAREQFGMVLPEPSQFVLVPLSPRESSRGEDPGVQNSRH